ncbi:MAG: hypothetical protein ACO2PM_21230 [Pyrobaculum sp.]|jgi:hypothetical protein
MQRKESRQTALVLRAQRRSSLLRAVAFVASVGALALFAVPAVLDHVLGGALQSALPPAIFNAVHELRHLMGIPCH